MVVSKHCDNCFYCGRMVNGSLLYCKYLFVTNQMRPCPPGDGCTVKVPRRVYRKKKKGAKTDGN